MNDYLHNLVARTLQLSPLVRPRLPSLFEPLAAGQAVNASSPSETIREDATPTPSASEIFRGRGQQVTSETGSRATTPGTVDGDPGKNLGATRRAMPQPSELTRSTPQIVAPMASPTMAPEASSIRTLITKAAQTHGPKSGTEAAASETEANGLSERSKSETRPIDLPAEERSRGRRDRVETTTTRVLASRVPRAEMRHDHSERYAAPHEAAPFSAPDTTPTINVTIGRVDVRAVFPQTQIQPTRRTHPAPMSLDEYLKHRSEGRK